MRDQVRFDAKCENIFRPGINFTSVLLLCSVLMVCLYANSKTRAQEKHNSATVASGSAAKVAANDKGDFKLTFAPVKDKENAEVAKLLRDSKLFERLVADSNARLALPVDVRVVFRDCDGKDEDPTNAFYSSKDHSITLCYGLVKKSEDLFKDDEHSQKDLEEAVLGSTAWTFYHEMGHALIDIYEIAHTGKEEDAADELSTFILINGGDEGEKAALSGAEDFWREAGEDNDLSDVEMADTHSLSKQRFYNIVCWVYGTNEEKYAYLTEGDDPTLPEARAGECQGEYQRIAKAWQLLLASHLKK